MEIPYQGFQYCPVGMSEQLNTSSEIWKYPSLQQNLMSELSTLKIKKNHIYFHAPFVSAVLVV